MPVWREGRFYGGGEAPHVIATHFGACRACVQGQVDCSKLRVNFVLVKKRARRASRSASRSRSAGRSRKPSPGRGDGMRYVGLCSLRPSLCSAPCLTAVLSFCPLFQSPLTSQGWTLATTSTQPTAWLPWPRQVATTWWIRWSRQVATAWWLWWSTQPSQGWPTQPATRWIWWPT